MTLKIKKLSLDGVFVYSPEVYFDERGCFYENFNVVLRNENSMLKNQMVKVSQ